MRKTVFGLLLALLAVALLSGCDLLDNRPGVTREWKLMEKSGKGTTVNLYAWGGDTAANEWFDKTLKPYLLETYQITLNRVPMNYDEIFEKLQNDMDDKKAVGEMDLLWISGTNFEYAMKKEFLFGPVTDRLPAYGTHVDPQHPESLATLGIPLLGYAVPLGRKQMALFYNEDVLYDPPTDLNSLMAAVKANKGKFTYPSPEDPAGMAFLQTVVYGTVGSKTVSDLQASKGAVAAATAPAFQYLKEMKPYLWQEGARYPATEGELDALFQDGTLVMAMSTDHNHATRLLAEDRYNPAAKPFTLETGTVGRTHYLAIPFNAANKSGAMVAINACLSVEMQSSKFRVADWGDIPVLNPAALSAEDLRLLKKGVTKRTSPKLEDLLDHRQPELSPALQAILKVLWYEQIAQ